MTIDSARSRWIHRSKRKPEPVAGIHHGILHPYLGAAIKQFPKDYAVVFAALAILVLSAGFASVVAGQRHFGKLVRIAEFDAIAGGEYSIEIVPDTVKSSQRIIENGIRIVRK